MIPRIRELPGMHQTGAAKQSKIAMEGLWHVERGVQKQLQTQGVPDWRSFKIRHAYNNSGRECVVSMPNFSLKTVDGYAEFGGI